MTINQNIQTELPDVGFRFARYLLMMGIGLMPVLIWFDFMNSYAVPAYSKIITLFICIVGLILAKNIRHSSIVRIGAAVTLLIMSLIGALYKLDNLSGIMWVPVLPVLFCFLVGSLRGMIFSLIYLLVYAVSYFNYQSFQGVEPVSNVLWITSVLAFLVTFAVSVFFRSEKRKDEHYLKCEAELDYLTQVYNRRGIIPYIEKEVDRVKRYSSVLSVILLDIDDFKKVNDQFGHKTGDTLLVEFASLIQKNIRGNDMIARWGGEEFLILVPEIDINACAELAEKLRDCIEQQDFELIGKMTASFGVTHYSKPEPWERFVERGDSLLYDAKRRGKNNVQYG